MTRGVQHSERDLVNGKGITQDQTPVRAKGQQERREGQSRYNQARNWRGFVRLACIRRKESAGGFFDNAQGAAMINMGVGQGNLDRSDL